MVNSSNKKTSTTTITPEATANNPFIFDVPSELDGIEDVQDDDNSTRRRTIQEITTVPAAKRRGSKSNIVKAGLLPPSYYKNPSVSGQVSSEIDELKFKDPFSRKTKERLKQTYTDYTVCSALATLIHYVLGRGAKATVYPVSRDQLKTQEEVDAKLNEVINEFSLAPTSMEDLQNFIDMVDLNCELYERHLQEAMAQAYVFGRSALWIVRANSKIDDPNEGNDMLQKWGFREGVPVSLRPLDSMNLGQVTVDTKSWEPKKIEYVGHLGGVSDVSRQRDELEELDVKDLIYFTRDDYNIIPDSYNYGFARLLDAVNVSENKRRLTKRVFAEIDNNQWAGLNIYEIAGMSEKDMQAFATSLKPGRSKVTNQPLKVHNVNPQFDMSGNLAQLKDLTLALLSACKVPSFLMNYEQITNRATTESVLIAWQQTVLEAERNWLRAILWKYWYRQLLEFYFPDKQFLYMKIKILLEFQSIEFASFFERSISVNNLYASRIITVREARELLNLTPFPAEDEDEAVGREQQDLVDKLLKENPDMVEPLKQIDQTKQQADEKIAKIEDPNQLMIGPGTTTKAKSAGQILTRLRSSAKKPSGG